MGIWECSSPRVCPRVCPPSQPVISNSAGICSALTAYRKSQAASSSSSSSAPTQSLPPELEVVTSSEREVEAWKEKRIAGHRQAYQEHLLSGDDTTDTGETIDTGDTTDAMEVEGGSPAAAANMGSGAGHVTHSSDSHGSDDVTHTERKSDCHVTHSDIAGVKSGSHVTYGELIENTEVPQLIHNLRAQLDSVMKKL